MTRPADPDVLSRMQTRDPALVALALRARAAILARVPEAWELVYDTYALSTAFAFTGALKTAFCHVPIYEGHVNLGFNRGAELDDPHGLLGGTGKLIRHLRLAPDTDLEDGPVAELLEAAVAHMRARLEAEDVAPTPGRTVLKSSGAKGRR